MMSVIILILTAVRNERLKVESEEYHSISEEIIPSKTKYDITTPKKHVNGGLKTQFEQEQVGLCTRFTCMGEKNHKNKHLTVIFRKALKWLQNYV